MAPTVRHRPTTRAHEDDFELAMNAACVGAWRWDLVADVLHLSSTARGLVGTPPGGLPYQQFLARVHPGDRTITDRTLRTANATGEGYDLDFRTLSPDGAGRWLRMRGRARADPDDPPEVARGILIDVARRKTAREANGRLAAIVASSDDAIMAKTLDGTVTDWNRGAEMIFGYPAEEIIGRPIAILLPPGRENEESEILERLKRGERVEPFETARRRKDGEIIDVLLTVSPLWDDSGRLVGGSKVAREITAVRRARIALAEREANLQSEREHTQKRMQELQAELIHMSRFTALGEMASTLAHELNQPLSAVANYLKGGRRVLAGGRSDAIPMAREAMERATEQALRAGQIIRHLRDFVGRGESERRLERLAEVIEEASALALIGAKETGLRVSFEFDPRAEFVFADKIQIQQVLLNLIRNAVEAMQETPSRRLVVSSCQLDQQTVEVSIADSGPGIAPEIAAQLFQPFITTKRQGMGVGLSISRTIIEAHGGRLWVEPNPGGGAVFRLTLKAATEEEDIGDGEERRGPSHRR